MSTERPPSSDCEVVVAVRAGEIERFEELVERYRTPLMRVAFSRVGRWGMAEDVVQEAFVCAFRSLHSYDSRYSFRTWLWTILINLCKRHYAKHKRRTEHEEDQVNYVAATDQTPSSEPDPEQRAMEGEQAQQLRELIASLPDVQADAVRLRFFGGLKFQEIADAMGCSLSSAKNRVRWGLEKLSGKLNPPEQTVGVATPNDNDAKGSLLNEERS